MVSGMTIIRTISARSAIIDEHYISKVTTEFLFNPWGAFALFGLALWGYVGARIHSMRVLYKEASEAEWVYAPALNLRSRSEDAVENDMSRRVVAEFFGTFWLVMGGCG